jgi:hypothetical protein
MCRAGESTKKSNGYLWVKIRVKFKVRVRVRVSG